MSETAPELPRPRIMTQRWLDAAFLHWRVDAEQVAPLLPAGTRPDALDGSTWVGLIAFRMVGAGIGTGPAVPWLGSFAETNVRLYSVDRTGRQGVVFRSLEAERLAVVLGARAVFGLPYMWARMRVRREGDLVTYDSARRWPGPAATSRLTVRVGAFIDRPDPLAVFLTGRWGLHVAHAGRTWFVPNEHGSWPLREASVVDLDDGLVAAAAVPGVVGRAPDSVLWSPGVRTSFGRPQPVPR